MDLPPCHLWTEFDAVLDGRRDLFRLVRTCLDESHTTRALVQCGCCGRLYLREWHEEIDWDDGDDASHETWVPVTAEAEIEALLAMPPGLMLASPRLLNDHPMGKPRRRHWIGDPTAPLRLPGQP